MQGYRDRSEAEQEHGQDRQQDVREARHAHERLPDNEHGGNTPYLPSDGVACETLR